MCALIAMAVFDTEENGRSALTDATLASLDATVNYDRHRLIVVDNGSCQAAKELLGYYRRYFDFEIITLVKNYGTARAINRAWLSRRPDEVCIKIDNDVVIHQAGWVDALEAAIARDPKIGLCGLKRKDLAECPWSDAPFFRSTLRMLPHLPGQPWLIVEEVQHVMGTAVAHNPRLLDKIGFLAQPGLYGFDDSLMAWRSHLAGFCNVFLPHIDIDHIDPGGTDYQRWKEEHARADMAAYNQLAQEYLSGARPLYAPSGWED